MCRTRPWHILILSRSHSDRDFCSFWTQTSTLGKRSTSSPSLQHTMVPEREGATQVLCVILKYNFLIHGPLAGSSVLCGFFSGISLPLSLLPWFSYYIYVFTFVHMDIEAIYLYTHSLFYSYMFSDAFRDPKTSVFFAPIS